MKSSQWHTAVAPHPQPLLFGIHLHTRHDSGCSSIEAPELVRKVLSMELEGIALTEQGIRWPDEKIEVLKKTCGAQGLVIIPGP